MNQLNQLMCNPWFVCILVFQFHINSFQNNNVYIIKIQFYTNKQRILLIANSFYIYYKISVYFNFSYTYSCLVCILNDHRQGTILCKQHTIFQTKNIYYLTSLSAKF